jgi:hypothetical protein
MNWIFGFVTGVLIVVGYNRIYSEPVVMGDATNPEDIIAAYNAGAKDILKLNPIDVRLESTCVQLWGMKQ